MSRYIFILVLSAFLTYGVISLTENRTIDNSTSNAVDFYSYSMAREVAKSGMQMAMSQVGDNPDWRCSTPQKVKCFDGEASFYVKDTIFTGSDLIKFYVDGSYNGIHHNITAYVDKFPLIPPAIRGAITTNNDVLTLGSINVDGRNHTMSGTLVPESGTYAIWTTQTVDQSGSSYLGGTNQGTDIPLLKPADPRVIAELQTYPGGYPLSPDSILGGPAYGYPEGMLKSIAMSGINGSQYVTDPAVLTHPLSGVTYIEVTDISPHNKWENAEVEGSGILVVHNKSTNALIWNMEYGTFRGLVIVDDMIHVHTTIIGALVVLSPNPNAGNTIGNSDGLVQYSTEAIRLALNQTNIPPKYNYGFGNNRLYIKYWYE